jgi:hypothetical protein
LVGFKAKQRFNDHGPPTAGPILGRRRDDGRVGVPPATAAADLVRRKLISARELAELVLARIDALNPALNAVVEVTVEAVLGQAAAADEAVARGRDLGPWRYEDDTAVTFAELLADVTGGYEPPPLHPPLPAP